MHVGYFVGLLGVAGSQWGSVGHVGGGGSSLVAVTVEDERRNELND